MGKEMAKAYKNGKMEMNMMANGVMICRVGKVSLSIRMETYIQECGRKVSIMGKEN